MMPELIHTTVLPVPPERLWRWLTGPGALPRLVPPWSATAIHRAEPVADGSIAELGIPAGPFRFRWTAEHALVGPMAFTDTQRQGPFASWVHRHEVAADPTGCLLTDTVRWRAVFPLGLAMDGAVRRDLSRMFAWRRRRMTEDLDRLARFAHRPLRIAVSGAGGLVGSDLCAVLRSAGHTVLPLQRRPGPEPGIAWDGRRTIDAHALATCDAVVHLAGEPVAQRWTPAARERIRASRVEGTGLLARTLAALSGPPRPFICASGISFAGDRGETVIDETTPQGGGFLAEVVAAWESAAEPARAAGCRTVHARIGIVLDPRGGALAKMLPAFRAGVAGPLGDGRAYMPWIALDDLVDILHRAVVDPTVTGVINACGPKPVTNRDFTATLARVLRRPAFLPVPAAALRLMFGAMADEAVLASVRAEPHRLQALDHPWRHGDLEDALRTMLGRI